MRHVAPWTSSISGPETIAALTERGMVRDVADLYDLTVEQVAALPGFARTSAENLVATIDASRSRGLARLLTGLGIRRLARAGVRTSGRTRRGGPGPLAGKAFVLTGALRDLTREAARDVIERSGRRVSDFVSQKTDYVVVGERPGSKLIAARRLGVRTLHEPAFLRMVRAA